jgi:peptidyl-prolyl cis-trans isomerase D
MFEYIRTHQRLMMLLLLLLIFPSFVFFGIDSFSNSAASSGVATVAGEPITHQQFDDAMRDRLDRLRQQFGPQFDERFFNTPETKKRILDDLVQQRALQVEAKKLKVTIADAKLQEIILNAMKKPDGSFDKERYQQIVAAQNMTPAAFEKSLREDMAVQQLMSAIESTSFTPKAVIERFHTINEQQREVQSLHFQANDFASQVKITDAMLQSYYEKNAALFSTPELGKAQYLVLNGDSLASEVTVSDAEVEEQYKKNEKSYTTQEQRRASHILVNADESATADVKKAAKEKAERLLAQVRKDPASFAAVAKEHSDDPGSKEKGGDLDYFGRGAMVPAFDEAVFKMKTNDVSDLVQTNFGYHIIYLTDVKAGGVKPLAEAKDQIVSEIKARKAAKLFSDKAEEFRDALDEQSDDLKAVADKFKLKVESTDEIARTPNPGLGDVPANNAKFLTALFSSESIKKKTNTGAIDAGKNVLIAGRLVEYKPAGRRPFDAVKSEIVGLVTAVEAEALAKKAGEAKLAALKAADDATGFGAATTSSRQDPKNLAGVALSEVFKADVKNLPTFVGVAEPTIGYTIYRISSVTQGAPNAEKRSVEEQQLRSAVSQSEMTGYLEALKKKAKVKINDSALVVKAPESVE